MFNKILIANRGEIAVRAVRVCREMGITAVALYDPSDMSSLHVRLADECVRVDSPDFFMDGPALVQLAQARGADAIYPGYGFLAEETDFAQLCQDAGITFIGPPPELLQQTRDKLAALARVREAGFLTVESSPDGYGRDDAVELQRAADQMGYPLVIKSYRGGRGRGARLALSPEWLAKTIRHGHQSQADYSDWRVYLEKAILPAHQISVQVVGDRFGNLVCLGEREGSIMYHNQKVIEESPAPCLMPDERARLWQTAVAIARLFHYQNVGSVEFLVTDSGDFYFSEIKARIQVEHPLTEMRSGVDLLQEQIRVAAGETLSFRQEDIYLCGWAVLARIYAEDPWRHFLPSPGRLARLRVPSGPDIRVDTYTYSGCQVPAAYAPLFAKLTAWGPERAASIARLRQGLADFAVAGIPTNIPLLQQIVAAEGFVNGRYHTGSLKEPALKNGAAAPHLRDLAVIAAITYIRRHQQFDPAAPERLLSGWHRESRRIGNP
ncbi:MAG TPA: biotin carboxylase N-terminal domain-containing protein [Chloroflexota bacterium]|nr:biotin carboxylase N-terminal domain-containing protein [Chloroflexota bacterium]